MKKNEDREKVMEEVDKVRAKGVYSHTSDDCSDACKARGKSFVCQMQHGFKDLLPTSNCEQQLLDVTRFSNIMIPSQHSWLEKLIIHVAIVLASADFIEGS